MRRDQLIRQWSFLSRLEASQAGLTVRQMAADGGVSERTVYRDLEDLQTAGFPLPSVKEDGETRWQFVDGYVFKTPRPIRASELLALHLARDMLTAFRGTVFHQDLEGLWQTVEAGLAPATRDFLEGIKELYRIGPGPDHHYAARAEIVARLNQALGESWSVDMAYHSLKSPERQVRRVDPYALWFKNNTLYLVAFCHRRGQVRIFAVDRISMTQTTAERFTLPADFDLDRYLADCFGVMRGETCNVRIRISPAWARYVAERTWHPSQHIQQHIDGGIEIAFRVAGLEEIRQWVLSLGPEAMVIEPPALKAAVAESLAEALARYDIRDQPTEAPQQASLPGLG
ncbi:MAG: transcriptional regulator [Desulfobacteraceae bacterium]|jgi:predicted DNA-binding transcriptional regulator YafY|nr:transcriptional regulator [Desulfobacteraceae bacterium]